MRLKVINRARGSSLLEIVSLLFPPYTTCHHCFVFKCIDTILSSTFQKAGARVYIFLPHFTRDDTQIIRH